MRRVIQRKKIAAGFTKSKREVIFAVCDLKRDFYFQNHDLDPVNYIADGLDSMGYIDNDCENKINKYQLVNRFLLSIDEIPSLYDRYQLDHTKRPDPFFSYENSEMEDYLV